MPHNGIEAFFRPTALPAERGKGSAEKGREKGVRRGKGVRILLAGCIDSLNVQGTPIVGIPQRDTLVVTGSEDVAGLEYLAEIMTSRLSADPAISGVPLILNAGQWETFVPPPQEPNYRAMRKLTSSTSYHKPVGLIRPTYLRSFFWEFLKPVRPAGR